MKKWTISALLVFLLSQVFVYGQNDFVKQRVFDGDGLNIKFNWDEITQEISDIMFTGKDATGKVVWKMTTTISSKEKTFEERPGFYYIIKDASGQRHSLSYNTDLKKVRVDKLDASNKSITLWMLYERGVKQTRKSNNTAKMEYVGSINFRFVYNKDEETITGLEVYSSGTDPGYRTIKITDNGPGMNESMYCTGTYKDTEIEVIYYPGNMKAAEITITNTKNNTSKTHKAKLKS